MFSIRSTNEWRDEMKSIKLLAAVAAVTVSTLASATAPARINGDVPGVIVQYSEPSLATATGVRNLHARLRNAAQSVCAVLDSRVLGLHEQYQQCVRDAVAQGVATVDNANLTNYHRTRSLPRALAAN
jgi:UrcA family protein